MSAVDQPSFAIAPRPADALLSFGGADFAGALSLGAIIKGRVLRHFEGDRYLVNFSGHNKVVDSAIPFTTGEIFYGKVVGLGERVELTRVRNAAADAETAVEEATLSAPEEPHDEFAEMILAHLQPYQVLLADADLRALASMAKSVEDPRPLVLGAVILHKLGLPPADGQLLAALQGPLSRKGTGLLAYGPEAIDFSSRARLDNTLHNQNFAFVAALSELIRAVANNTANATRPEEADALEGARGSDQRTPGISARDDDESEPGERRNGAEEAAVARFLLNVQSDGSIAHRVSSIPLFIDGELVELDVALFDQKGGGSGDVARRYRQVVLSLELDQLGALEINATTVGNHVRLCLMTETPAVTEQMALHAGHLRRELEAHEWLVDELRYETRTEQQADTVARTVVEHLIARDTVNRLV